MKKTYINPTIEVIVLKNQQSLLAGSVQAPFGDGTLDGGNATAPLLIEDELLEIE
jgi:hypothetical protein